MLIRFLQKNKFCCSIIRRAGRYRARDITEEICQYLNKEDNILDIGAGTCNICAVLRRKEFQITPLDVSNLSFVDDIKPIIYDGQKIPFDDDSFDVSLILTVLHHTPDPRQIIKEAKRVSKKIIIMEDIYTNVFHKYATFFLDSLLNFEFKGHPHTNKSDREWKILFKELGLRPKATKYRRSFLVFKQAVYYLES